MTAISGLASGVAWTGYTGLYASTGYVNPYAFSLNVQGGTFTTTGSSTGGVVVATNGTLPYSWGGSITCRAPKTPASGYSGSVAWSSGNYATNVREWTLEASCGEKDVTAFDGSGILAKAFLPLLWSWRGTFAGYIDGTTALALPTAPGATLATLTLKLLDNGVGTDDTLVGTAATENLTGNVGTETGGEFSYGFTGSGTLTADGDNYGANSSGVFDDSTGALITPSAGSLVLTAASGRTYTGNAFPTRLSWRVGVASGSECTIDFRGTGALTIA